MHYATLYTLISYVSTENVTFAPTRHRITSTHFNNFHFTNTKPNLATMFKKRNSKSKRSLLKCPTCWGMFLKGRSYSNHVPRCPALRLITPPTSTITASAPVNNNTLPPHSPDGIHSVARMPDHESDDSSIPPTQDCNESDNSSTGTHARVELPDAHLYLSDNPTASDDEKQSTSSKLSTRSSESNSSVPVLPSIISVLANNNNHTSIVTDEPEPTDTLQPSSPIKQKRYLIQPATYYTVDDAVHLQLLNICHEIQAPRYAFDMLLKWSHESHSSGYGFPSSTPSRKTFMDRLYSQFHMSGAKPILVPVNLLPNKTATVVTFSFTEMVQSLLSDATLMQPENLIIRLPGDNSPALPDSVIGDINTGSWYKAATIKLCVNDTDCLCPIFVFIDKTQIDMYSKWSLEPVLMTLGIFNLSTRNRSCAWRPIGLVPNTTRMSSATRAEYTKGVS